MRRPALEGVSFTVTEGERVLIAGPSGSGKTTLLNLMAGLDRPDEGELTVLGHPLHRLGESALSAIRGSEVGVVFQHHLLPPGLTAEEVVAAPLLWSRNAPLEDALARARELLEVLELSRDEMGRRVEQLSGGQRQRIAFARAVAPDPAVLLADEPTAQLDEHTAEVLLDCLMDWSSAERREPRTLVLVSHERLPGALAGEFRLLTIRDGRLSEGK